MDARSDVFSFGAVLYEMATGRRAFGGSSTAEVLAALMKEEPKPPSEVVADLPKELDRLIRRCLQKEPARRFQHTADVKLELEQIKEDSETGRKPAPSADRKRGPWLAAGVALALVLAAATWWWRRPPDVPLDPPRLEPVTSMSGDEVNPTLSPDGDQLAFVWIGEKGDDSDIYLKMIGSSEMRRLTTDPAGRLQPALVSRRATDRVSSTRSRRGGKDPPHLARHRVGPQAQRLSRRGLVLMVSGRSLARRQP